jgi:hypothetical protein
MASVEEIWESCVSSEYNVCITLTLMFLLLIIFVRTYLSGRRYGKWAKGRSEKAIRKNILPNFSAFCLLPFAPKLTT